MQELIDKQIEYGKKPSVLEAYDKEWAARGDAYSEGHDSGFEEGALEQQKEIIMKIQNKGKSLQEISDLLDIPLEEVTQILAK